MSVHNRFEGFIQFPLNHYRGKKLRKAFKVDEKSTLFNRNLRNAWKHFDERLDENFLEIEAGYFFPSSMLNTHTLADDPMGHIFKLLDVEEECLVLMGKKYYFATIRSETQSILHKAKDFDAQGGRLIFENNKQ